jgi:hypothetical protein
MIRHPFGLTAMFEIGFYVLHRNYLKPHRQDDNETASSKLK